MKKRIIISLSLCLGLLAGCRPNPQLAPGNIDNVIRAMSLEEKAKLVVGVLYAAESDPVALAAKQAVPGQAGATYPIERLGIPSITFADGPEGARLDVQTTQFPVASLLSCTFDDALLEEVGAAIGAEIRDSGIDVLLAPSLNIQRSPLNGRNYEYFSEDPYVSGKTAAALVRGVQSQGVGATIKHFAANNAETNRRSNNVCVSPRALREIYLRGFEIAVKESSPWLVMSSANLINGTHTSENHDLLETVLRSEWGFNGAVVSVWNSSKDMIATMKAGNDLVMPGREGEVEQIIDAVHSKALPIEDLDRNVRRILELIVKTPEFMRPGKPQDGPSAASLKAHSDVALRAARDGMVLLENNGALPFNTTDEEGEPVRIALYGDGCHKTVTCGKGAVIADHETSLAEGLVNEGYLIASSDAEADAAIVMITRDSGARLDKSVKDFNLTSAEKNLVRSVCARFHAMGKKVAVILNVGHVIETSTWKKLPDAILLSWWPGQEAGDAIAQIVSGKVNPSGKLAQTFPITLADIASTYNFPIKDAAKDGSDKRNIDFTLYQEGVYVGYRYFDSFKKNVAYPFGHGLSYTTFRYDEPEVIEKKSSVKINVDIFNSGRAAGREVVQVYVKAPMGSIEKPVRELRSYAKTPLLYPGEKCTVSFDIPYTSFASFNESSHSWVTDAGTYIIEVGSSSRDIREEVALDIDDSMAVMANDVLTLDRPVNELRARKSIFRERFTGTGSFKPKALDTKARPDSLTVTGEE